MALANYPGFHTTGLPGSGTPYGVYWPALVPADVVEQVVVGADGSRTPVGPSPTDGGIAFETSPWPGAARCRLDPRGGCRSVP